MTPRPPQLSSREVIRLLESRGFSLERQSGSHAVYRHPDGRWTTVALVNDLIERDRRASLYLLHIRFDGEGRVEEYYVRYD
jgi:predicted RNA binding protein YcfA (HicA-like mRNA interferase family)